MNATFGIGGVMKAPFNFLEWWGIVDPLTFLDEGGIFSLECPRATAVFGQTVMSVVSGGGGINDPWPLLSDPWLSMGWGRGVYGPYPFKAPAQPAKWWTQGC